MMPPKAPLVTAASYAPSPRPFSEMRQQAWPRLKHDNFQQPAKSLDFNIVAGSARLTRCGKSSLSVWAPATPTT